MRIKKTSETRAVAGKILNVNSGSTTDTYSCDYMNKELYYKNGDVYSVSHQYYAGGCLTGSAKEVMFTISLPKRLTNITSVAISGVNIAARMIDGTYGINGAVSDVSVADFGDNYVSIDVKSSTAIGTNNTPVSVYIRSLTLTFTS